jgi:acyl carrier protein
MTREEILAKLSGYLTDMFEVPPEAITLDAKLYEDLDLDSIDAVDLVVKLQELTGRKIKPEQFKTVRTVGDVVDQVHELFAETAQ